MRLQDLASSFARLEATGPRLAAVRMVAELFSRLPESELEAAVYLLQGQLGPPYEGVELGVGELLLVRILARAYHSSEAVVAGRYRRAGDLGLVAESLATERRSRQLTVRRAYDALLDVAQASGAGAVERKTHLLVALLGRASSLEARYLVRIVQGRLRLGIGDATVIEATALGAFGDRRKKAIVEHAYNVRSDLGAVVRLAYAKGERGL
ncbi:MAG TPA: hypothetical protein VEU73_04280, partial [Gemmatimonadales bacterium]|nr:hypothetical protein [Gemmatimonadales bacterium]